MNISTLLDDNVHKFGEFETVNYDGKWKTNLEIHQDASRLGHMLMDLGIKQGDRVILQVLNCPEAFVSFPAINRIGASIVPLSPLLRPDQASYIFRDCGAKAIVTSNIFLEGVLKAKENAPDLEHVILIDQDDCAETVSYQKEIQKYPSELETVETENEDLAALIYTAGTTGRPKGVMHTNFSLYINTLALYEYLLLSRPKTVTQIVSEIDPRTFQTVEQKMVVTGVERSRVALGVLPLSHSYGIAFMNLGAMMGGKTVLHPWWDVNKAFDAIQTYRVDTLALVPTMYIQIVNHPDLDKHDLSSLEVCACGSAPMPLEIAHKWEERTGLAIREGWGMTESGATTCGMPPAQKPKYGSIGKSLLKCNRVTIFDENGQETPPNQNGEIVVKGPTVMKGYWNNEEETTEALKDGWLYTGDIGYKDEDGFIFITDRKKDIIIRGGENVSPREVEEVLFKHPSVLEVGVVGIKDEVYGESIKAFIVLREGKKAEVEEIISFCKKHLPTFKTPKTIQILDALPKNPVGKVLRSELRKLG